jgi:hypothetical protein
MSRATKIELGDNGLPLTPEQALIKRKNVDFTKVKWPIVNPVKFERKDVRSSKMLTLTSYRYPAQD